MEKNDARRLSPDGQADLRCRVMRATKNGLSQSAAARLFGVSRQSVSNWRRRMRSSGIRGLYARRRGRPARPRLTPVQTAMAVRMISKGCPDQLKLPFALWTRDAVGALLRRRFGVAVSVWTVGRYLQDWGLTPQKPIRRAYEQDPEAVRKWLAEEYPTIRSAARRDGAEIQWGDEMGLRSDHQSGRTWGLKGQTPVVMGTGQRFRCNMISTVTNRGHLRFMTFTVRFRVPVLLKFLRRLVRQTKRPIYLIVDGHPVHKARRVKQWLHKHQAELKMFLLPAYSPELNPDELLNQDVKANTIGRQRPHDVVEMKQALRVYLHSTQQQPQIVRNYFLEENVRYAAD